MIRRTHLALFAIALLAATSESLAFRSFFNDGSGHLELSANALRTVRATRLITDGFHPYVIPTIAGYSEFPDHPWERGYAEEDHFDNESFESTNARLGAAQKIVNDRNDVLRFARTGQADGAWASLGMALHTIADFYSHSSWVEVRNGAANHTNRAAFLSSLTIAGQPPPGCGNDGHLNGSTNVTSAYYRRKWPNPNPPLLINGVAKCVHGGILTNWNGPGYDRDEPGNTRHEHAADVAVIAMANFVQDIVDELERSRTITDDRAVCTLLGLAIEVCDRLSNGAIEVWRLDSVLVVASDGGTFTNYRRSTNGAVTTNGGPGGDAKVSIGDTICREGTRWIPKIGERDFVEEERRFTLDSAGNFSGSNVRKYAQDDGLGKADFYSKQRVTANLDTSAPYSGFRHYYWKRLSRPSQELYIENNHSEFPARYELGTNNGVFPDMERLRTLPAGSIIPTECTVSLNP